MLSGPILVAIFTAGLVPVIYLLVNAALSRRRSSVGTAPPASAAEVTVVVPVRGEAPERLRECLRSVAGRGSRVLVVGDGEGEPYRSVALAEGAEFLGLAEPVGKKGALAAGLSRVESRFVLFLDSDTVLDEGAVERLTRYFGPEVGGVGANLFVRENGSVAGRCAEFVERAREVVLRAMSSRGSVLYLDGACVMFRTELIRSYVASDDFQRLKVLGRPTRLGDDWLLTDHILSRGYRTVKAYDVAAETDRPAAFGAFVRQNVRWSRSSWIRLGRYLTGHGPRNAGLFYRFELAGTYALPILALLLGIVRFPYDLKLAGRFFSWLLAVANGVLPDAWTDATWSGAHALFSAQTVIGAVAVVAFALAVALRLAPGRRASTLAYGLLGSTVLLFAGVYGLFTFWRASPWRDGAPAPAGLPGKLPALALGPEAASRFPNLRR